MDHFASHTRGLDAPLRSDAPLIPDDGTCLQMMLRVLYVARAEMSP